MQSGDTYLKSASIEKLLFTDTNIYEILYNIHNPVEIYKRNISLLCLLDAQKSLVVIMTTVNVFITMHSTIANAFATIHSIFESKLTIDPLCIFGVNCDRRNHTKSATGGYTTLNERLMLCMFDITRSTIAPCTSSTTNINAQVTHIWANCVRIQMILFRMIAT